MTKRYMTIAVMAGLGLGAANALATEPQPTSNEALQQKLDQLQAEIQQLKTAQAQQQQDAINAKQVDDTVTRVLQDADKRSQLMQMEGFTAGWSNGRFMLGSADGDFTFMPGLLIQVRSTSNYDTSGDGNSSAGFSLPRVNFGIDGKVFHDWQYFVRWNSGDSDGGGSGNLNLQDAWIQHALNDQFSVRSGQFVDPVFHEQLVDSGRLMACDRSLLNEIITGQSTSYVEGAMLMWTPDNSPLTAMLAYTNGFNSQNSNFQDYPVGKANFGIAGRAEYALVGNKGAAYQQFTSMGDKEENLVVGAGFDATQAGDTTAWEHTVDVQWNGGDGKLALYGAFVGQWIQNGAGAGITGVTASTNQDSYNWGFLVQGSYMLDQNWEVFARYDYTHLDDGIPVGSGTSLATEDTFNEATVGVNYYFHGHNAKWTADLGWVSGAPNGTTNLGYVNSSDSEYVLRTQLQLML